LRRDKLASQPQRAAAANCSEDSPLTQKIKRRGVFQTVALGAVSYLLPAVGKAATAEAGEVAGALKTLPGGCIVLSSYGEHLLVYFCDGSDTHPATVSRWMRRTITAGSLRIAAGDVMLVAQLQGHRATGTLTLANGTALLFVAYNHWPNGVEWSVYRGEAQLNGVNYVGGWIIGSDRRADISPPRWRIVPVALSAPSPADRAPPAPVTAVLDIDDVDDDCPHAGGDIINQQTGAVLPYVASNYATMTAEVPGWGRSR